MLECNFLGLPRFHLHHFIFIASVAAETSVSTKIESNHLSHFQKGLCSKDELWGISCKDIATDSKTIPGANIVGTLLAQLLQFTIKILHKYLNSNIKKINTIEM